MADSGRAAARHLALLLRTKEKFAKAFRQLPFLIPISWQCTNDQPTKSIYQKLAALESETVPTLSFAPGFPAADFPHCGPSVFPFGTSQPIPVPPPEVSAHWTATPQNISTAPPYAPPHAAP